MLRNFIFVSALVALLPLLALPASAAEKPDRKGILLVAFGTSVPEAAVALDSLVDAVREAFPDAETRVAWTSNIIRRKVRQERNLNVPTPPEALAKMRDDGFARVCVQPMHVIPGEEYDDLKSVVDAFASIRGKYGFRSLVLGRPFLSDARDCEVMAGILTRRFGKKAGDGRGVVLMGHGTRHAANAMYGELQRALSETDASAVMRDRIFVGTVEAEPGFDTVLAALKKTRLRSLILSPLMIVAGDHAANDLAGPEPDSWRSRFEKQGFDVATDLTGLGEYPEIRELFIKRVRELTEVKD